MAALSQHEKQAGSKGPVETGADSTRKPPPPEPVDATQSGDITVAFPALAPGTRVTRASLKVTGRAFQGLLEHLSGVNVTKSPVQYGSDGSPQASVAGQQAFIVDFTGIRTVLKLNLVSLGNITLVLPWLGIQFSDKSAYPAAADNGTVPSTSGDATIGFSGFDTTKLLIQVKWSGKAPSVADFLAGCRIVTGTFPGNLKASFNGRPPFFTRPGTLSGAADVTGMADDLNALLASSPPPETIQLSIATDTPGVLEAGFDPAADLEAQQSAVARFGGQPTLDVTLEALAASQAQLSFPTTSKASWSLSRLELDLAGRFPAWRAFSAQTSDAIGPLGLRVNAQFSVARRFPFAQDGDLYGFSLLFRAPAEAAGLHLEVVPEKDGQPGPGPAVAAADFSVPAGAEGTAAWAGVIFDSPVGISSAQTVWLVVRAKTGSVEWAGLCEPPSPAGATVLNNEGGNWQPYPNVGGKAPVALLRVLRRPFSQENQALLSATARGQTVEADLTSGAAVAAIDFPAGSKPVIADGSAASVNLVLTARAAGTLTIRRAQLFYQESTHDRSR
jgi:hypothetical protein